MEGVTALLARLLYGIDMGDQIQNGCVALTRETCAR